MNIRKPEDGVVSTEESLIQHIKDVQQAVKRGEYVGLFTAYTGSPDGDIGLFVAFVSCEDEIAERLKIAVKETVDRILGETMVSQ